jgi:hypothetical protein
MVDWIFFKCFVKKIKKFNQRLLVVGGGVPSFGLDL